MFLWVWTGQDRNFCQQINTMKSIKMVILRFTCYWILVFLQITTGMCICSWGCQQPWSLSSSSSSFILATSLKRVSLSNKPVNVICVEWESKTREIKVCSSFTKDTWANTSKLRQGFLNRKKSLALSLDSQITNFSMHFCIFIFKHALISRRRYKKEEEKEGEMEKGREIERIYWRKNY